MAEGQLDPCRICEGNGEELLTELECDPDFEGEAARVRSVLHDRNRKTN